MAEAITDRRVLAIALPIMLSNATVPILGAVDTGVVGQMGEAAPIGAVGIGAVILSAIYWIFGFLRMGTAGLVAQAHGAGDAAETGALLMRALLIAGAAGLGFILLQVPLFWGAFALAPASEEVETLAQTYLRIRIWGAPAAIGLYALTGWLIALERTRAVLIIQVWMNGLNIVLDLWFVLGLGWGVEGVAVATLIAEVSGAALALWFCRAAFSGAQWRDWARILDRAKVRRMMSLNLDIMLRSILMETAFLSFLFFAADQGDVTLAANQVLLQFLHITAYALDGFAFSAEALVGQAVGARNLGRLRRSVWLTCKWGAVIAIALAALFWAAGPWIIDLMTTSQEVRAEARRYLPWMILGPILGLAAWMLDGIFIGATRGRDMRNAMLVSTLIYWVCALSLVGPLGNHGLWLALMVFNVARGITLGVRYPKVEGDARAAA
ncbi:MAG: MATE family efflux transporter [Pseudomonadota bacterium]